jgi:hypothetical protein
MGYFAVTGLPAAAKTSQIGTRATGAVEPWARSRAAAYKLQKSEGNISCPMNASTILPGTPLSLTVCGIQCCGLDAGELATSWW